MPSLFPSVQRRRSVFPALDSSKAQILNFEVLVDSVLRTFAAKSRLLHSAEWRHLS